MRSLRITKVWTKFHNKPSNSRWDISYRTKVMDKPADIYRATSTELINTENLYVSIYKCKRNWDAETQWAESSRRWVEDWNIHSMFFPLLLNCDNTATCHMRRKHKENNGDHREETIRTNVSCLETKWMSDRLHDVRAALKSTTSEAGWNVGRPSASLNPDSHASRPFEPSSFQPPWVQAVRVDLTGIQWGSVAGVRPRPRVLYLTPSLLLRFIEVQ